VAGRQGRRAAGALLDRVAARTTEALRDEVVASRAEVAALREELARTRAELTAEVELLRAELDGR
jgi:hypothetical protein